MNTKTLIALTLVCLVIADKDTHIFQQFQKFIKDYSKKYSNINEYMTKYNIFKSNYEQLEAMTINIDISHSLGINQFSDMTAEEFRSTYLNPNILPTNGQKLAGKTRSLDYLSGEPAPDSFDWRRKNAVTKVKKDQGECKASFAFAAIANMEGLHAIKTGELISFSEQQLIDCDTYDKACEGGNPADAFKYIIEAGGIMTDDIYPYGGDKGSCKFKPKYAEFAIKGYDVWEDMNENDMKELLVKNGPLVIAMNANTLRFYYGGIFDWDDFCDPSDLNHFVTLVGYGTVKDKDYWIVKNSWGLAFGERGYFRIARGKGTCGINKYIATAKIE
jgi:cathepsin F